MDQRFGRVPPPSDEAAPLPRRSVDESRARTTSLAAEPREVTEAAAIEGNLFGDYVLVAEIGVGGSGQVFRAWHRPLGRFVALKFLHHEDETRSLRFVREAQLAARLGHGFRYRAPGGERRHGHSGRPHRRHT